MLLIIQDYRLLDYGQIMAVYEQSNKHDGVQRYAHLDAAQQLLQAEQDFYSYLRDALRNNEAICAFWAPGRCYKAALRLEKYSDGFLIAGLETAPEARQRGYATQLLRAIQEKFKGERLYSHIARSNLISIHVHEKCGFQRVMDHAVFLDGSVSYQFVTYLFET